MKPVLHTIGIVLINPKPRVNYTDPILICIFFAVSRKSTWFADDRPIIQIKTDGSVKKPGHCDVSESNLALKTYLQPVIRLWASIQIQFTDPNCKQPYLSLYVQLSSSNQFIHSYFSSYFTLLFITDKLVYFITTGILHSRLLLILHICHWGGKFGMKPWKEDLTIKITTNPHHCLKNPLSTHWHVQQKSDASFCLSISTIDPIS